MLHFIILYKSDLRFKYWICGKVKGAYSFIEFNSVTAIKEFWGGYVAKQNPTKTTISTCNI